MHLITTAHEETWPEDGPVLFLGEWCRRYSRRHVWEALGGEVVPYHWDDRQQMERDKERLGRFYEGLLAELADWLNDYHGVDHGLRYWRMLLGPWLGMLVAALADRWAMVVQSLDDQGGHETIVLAGAEDYVVPRDNAEFRGMVYGDLWNHVAFDRILSEETGIERVEIPIGNHCAMQDPAVLTPGRRERALTWLTRRSQTRCRPDDVVLKGTYMPWRAEVKVQVALRQFPVLWGLISPDRVSVPAAGRRGRISLPERGLDRFEDHVRRWCLAQMPTSYLEGYQELVEAAESSPLPERPRAIFTSSAHSSDELFKVWAAKRVERGTPLMIGQHGGTSGIARFSMTNDHEVAIADRFVTWGWSGEGDTPVKPVGQLKGFGDWSVGGKRKAQVAGDSGEKALLMLGAFPRYSYDLYDIPVSSQWLSYFDDQCEFVDALSVEVRQRLVVRLYQHDFGWDQKERWKDRYPELAYERSSDDLLSSLERSRVVITTYNGATFLETMAMGIPTIVFWDPSRSGISDRAVEAFDGLEEVGVFHRTASSAAAHVSSTWGDVEGWWTRPDVVAACDSLRNQFSWDPDGTPGRVVEELRSLIGEVNART